MTRKATIHAEQIAKAKQILNELPQKELPKTKEEATTILERDILKALKKGYSVQEIGELLKNEDIPIPATLIKKVVRDKGENSNIPTKTSAKSA